MAISSETSSATYAGNNSTSTAYSLAFPFSGAVELVVTHITSAGVRTTLAVTTGYTLHGDYAAGSGTLKTVAAIPVADTLLIERFTSAVQSLDSSSPAGSYPTSIETQLDRSTRAIQDGKRVAGRNFARSLRVPDGETLAELPAAANRKGEVVFFNATTGEAETKTPVEIFALADSEFSADVATAEAAAAAAEAAQAAAEAAAEGIALPTDANATIFFDDFQRADAGTNALGTAPSGQSWDVTGSGVANQRLINREIISVAPYGTWYAWMGGAAGLGFTPRKIGCTFRINQLGGGDSYLGVMGICVASQSLENMLHITWNQFNCSVNFFSAGVAGSNILSETFVSPLVDGVEYYIEVEIDPATNRIWLRTPSGRILTTTDALLSSRVGPHAFVEASTGTSPIANVAIREAWATQDSSQKDWFAGRIAQAKATAANAPHFTSLTGLTGNITSTAGALSMSSDADSTHILGRVRFHSPSSDQAIICHFNFTAYGVGFRQGPLGEVEMYAGPGQTWACGTNNVPILYGSGSSITMAPDNIRMLALPVHANNAAAVLAGLAVDRVYQTSTGELRIVV